MKYTVWYEEEDGRTEEAFEVEADSVDDAVNCFREEKGYEAFIFTVDDEDGREHFA